MTLQEVLDRGILRAGLTETSAEYEDIARQYANATLQDIGARATWWWLFKEGTITTVASQRAYALATDVLTPVSFRDTTNDRPLTIVSDAEADGDDPDQSRTGDSAWVYLAGADATTGAPVVEIHPTPDTSSETIKYRYYKTIPEFTASNDSDDLFTAHGIPVLLHQALYLGVTVGLMTEYGDDASAQLSQQGMERIIRQAREVNGRMSGNRDYRLRRRDSRFQLNFRIQEGSLS